MSTSIFLLAFVVASGFFLVKADSFTTEEFAALKKFRPMVEDVLYLDWMKRDEFLIKWIRDRSMNLETANQKLRKAIAWRKNNKIDEVLTDPLLKELESELPYKVSGYDRLGNPIIPIRFGQDWNLRRIAVTGKMKKAHRYMHGLLEAGYKAARDVGPNVTQWLFFGSATNFNLREHACLACLPFYTDFVANYEANYPETMRSIVSINAPKIYETISNLVRPIMSPGTRRAYKILGYDRQELRDYLTKLNIDFDQLEVQFGGNRPNEKPK